MKQLVRKPLLLAMLLTLPLWIAFGNFIVAVTIALLLAFLIAMCYALYTFKHSANKSTRPDNHDD
ncbi:hypothetical protein LSG25_17625 [Paralcaligenes sp. KSB-10]|jgi:hypothetical protein|uniref:hypothetical protein n=1 Tax=Paralcaligenes sp. KSB-10 TaxID=2901142 RepID=UPI001E2B35BD|nr:hypothetical protein [Paralcaligenes sp. KSB-10]UHL63833.1 hypothetical protein LSG25_17625 [Paralcaligenes sp. KSB-10]